MNPQLTAAVAAKLQEVQQLCEGNLDERSQEMIESLCASIIVVVAESK